MQNLFWGFLNFLGTFWNVVSRQVRETDQSAVSFLLILAGCWRIWAEMGMGAGKSGYKRNHLDQTITREKVLSALKSPQSCSAYCDNCLWKPSHPCGKGSLRSSPDGKWARSKNSCSGVSSYSRNPQQSYKQPHVEFSACRAPGRVRHRLVASGGTGLCELCNFQMWSLNQRTKTRQ